MCAVDWSQQFLQWRCKDGIWKHENLHYLNSYLKHTPITEDEALYFYTAMLHQSDKIEHFLCKVICIFHYFQKCSSCTTRSKKKNPFWKEGRLDKLSIGRFATWPCSCDFKALVTVISLGIDSHVQELPSVDQHEWRDILAAVIDHHMSLGEISHWEFCLGQISTKTVQVCLLSGYLLSNTNYQFLC